jgi:hypothetical protein
MVFLTVCVVILCFLLSAAAVWMGIESLDRSPRPADWS